MTPHVVSRTPHSGAEPRVSDRGSGARAGGHSLYVVPRGLSNGFRCTIGGHILDLADPGSGCSLAPTPNDLFVASLASEVAWSTRAFLRAHDLPVDVSVAASWSTHDDKAGPCEIGLTVTVSRRAEPASAELGRLLENGLGARLIDQPRVHISVEGGQ